ncbi:ABC transporter ATP-binding protein [Crassaminicella profunda]|uniref:ABC transporter ATP-binding protein n=1 Tax=Crassaminicella profunda TaxID=1286698 RepID=UPI001CA742EB|nr:ABC transporter ATP-binding protein [Crassaminicella profunda]QZY55370.1 ABC transporter ATP-binding protein [Crassaminicella profunda]
MIQATIRKLSKRYGKVMAINALDLDIYKGEMLTIVGPSGCGKSTLLSCIAGLEKVDDGEITIADELVSSKDYFKLPEKRQIGLVFQNYALWPHKNVFENIAYPLRIKKECKDRIKNEVAKVVSIVRLVGKERCYPHELSGGEQQRVALARALVMNPKILLLDEPLSNLDAKLREEMQYEIKRIQKDMNITIIHVTHDQYEAMGISDRIAVMNGGNLIQIGTPEEIYENPKTEFVAKFIGKANIIYNYVNRRDKYSCLELFKNVFIENKDEIKEYGKEIILSIRPEDIFLQKDQGMCKGVIIKTFYRGNMIEYRIQVENKNLMVQTSNKEQYEVGEEVWVNIEQVKILKDECK